jgi:hypothetical protein
MDLSNTKLGKYRHIIWTVSVLIGVSIPISLGAIGEDLKKIEENRNASIEVLKAQAQEVCKWQQAYVLEKNKTLTKAEDIIKNAEDLKKVQVDCSGYVVELISFTKTK